jgi:dolichol-phosphate mannosyltransferase
MSNGALPIRLAIVVPLFNEAAAAEECVRSLLQVVSNLPIPSGLITVDDGSIDGTGAILDRLKLQLGGFELVHQANGGYGTALVTGAREALKRGYDYVLFIDSDLTNPPEHIIRFIPPILDGADLVKGTRFSQGGDMHLVPWRRRIFSLTASYVARGLFRMHLDDCTNGFRAIRTELFVRMPLNERGFGIILEELYWAKRWGAIVASVPTSLRVRSKQQRASLFPYRPSIFWSYLKHALRAGLIRYRPKDVTGPV